jgi:hypothetical protein
MHVVEAGGTMSASPELICEEEVVDLSSHLPISQEERWALVFDRGMG